METKNMQFLLYGGSGHAKVIIECIKLNGHCVVGFFDDDPDRKDLGKVPFLGEYNSKLHTLPVIVSIGDNRTRKEIVGQLANVFGSIQHPSASISPTVKIGVGTVVIHMSIIQVDCVIGKHVIINTGASVGHECVIDDFVHVSPQATLCGNVKVGEGTHVGANAVVIPGITIGKWATIGAGSVIVRDVPDFAVVVGNPGRIIRYNTPVE